MKPSQPRSKSIKIKSSKQIHIGPRWTCIHTVHIHTDIVTYELVLAGEESKPGQAAMLVGAWQCLETAERINGMDGAQPV